MQTLSTSLSLGHFVQVLFVKLKKSLVSSCAFRVLILKAAQLLQQKCLFLLTLVVLCF